MANTQFDVSENTAPTKRIRALSTIEVEESWIEEVLNDDDHAWNAPRPPTAPAQAPRRLNLPGAPKF